MAQTKNRGLGRGFEALLPQNFDKGLILEPGEKVQKLSLDVLQPNAYQPRKHFDETALAELAASIKQYGIVQPLVVTAASGGRYAIIAGERRWRAAKLAGLTEVPALVRSSKELEQLEIAIIENVQRVDLSPLEQAQSIERLHQEFATPYEQIAKRLGKANSTINNIVRLLQLPSEAAEALAQKKISEGHARAILALKGQPEKQHRLLELALAQGWSVRQAERYVTAHKSGEPDEQKVHARVHTETPATKALSTKLGTPVHVKRMAKGGRLEVSFKSDEELERIINLLAS
ncbi:MAG TPA: ParB/RepB/Spo0J family partition protein [Patescibacteria group bacterium]|nr:ParB/RepB/Spo0J family partition protein [Patescibacteria group bacterium]